MVVTPFWLAVPREIFSLRITRRFIWLLLFHIISFSENYKIRILFDYRFIKRFERDDNSSTFDQTMFYSFWKKKKKEKEESKETKKKERAREEKRRGEEIPHK